MVKGRGRQEQVAGSMQCLVDRRWMIDVRGKKATKIGSSSMWYLEGGGWKTKRRKHHVFSFLCGTTRDRTRDTRIFSPLLYQLSYGTLLLCSAAKLHKDFESTNICVYLFDQDVILVFFFLYQINTDTPRISKTPSRMPLPDRGMGVGSLISVTVRVTLLLS